MEGSDMTRGWEVPDKTLLKCSTWARLKVELLMLSLSLLLDIMLLDVNGLMILQMVLLYTLQITWSQVFKSVCGEGAVLSSNMLNIPVACVIRD